MRVTIEGTKDQIEQTLGVPQKRARNTLASKERLERATEQRRLLRRAFDLLRYDPAEQETVNMLARALGGHADITSSLLDTARTICADAEQEA